MALRHAFEKRSRYGGLESLQCLCCGFFCDLSIVLLQFRNRDRKKWEDDDVVIFV
jgi:hypothetical protein